MRHRLLIVLVAALVWVTALPSAAQTAGAGILLLAHGGKPEWNARVRELASRVDVTQPTEVAFGMATRANIQAAVDRLVARGVRRIVAVPLFVSSHSSVVTSTAYLLGLRDEAPADLAIFARMSHGPHGHGPAPGPAASHAAHATPTDDGTRPVVSPVPISMTEALDAHPIVAAIVADRAAALSETPEQEAVVLVAHGPVPDDDNARWLQAMGVLATSLRATRPYAAVDVLTLRDDAPKPVRDSATAHLRDLVSGHVAAGRRVLVVPLLLSFGGIEQGLRTRLEELTYAMADRGLMPDERLEQWVREMGARATGSRF